MKKSEILELIEVNKIIKNNSDLLSITKERENSRFQKDKKYWFPNIEELKEEFNILSIEVQEALNEVDVCKQYIQNSNCNHDVRLEHYGLFGSNSKCIFCGKSIESDICCNFEYSINRNKYCASLVAKYQDDDDYGYVSDGYTNEQIYEVILNLLKDKDMDEEVDLVQEFKKLDLHNCKINDEKKVNENYILIIGGTNKKYIDKDTYIVSENSNTSSEYVKCFSQLLNTRVELIDNIETLENIELKKMFNDNYRYLKFASYKTKEELEKELLRQKDIPFKVIIDLSNLYEYKISNDVVTKEKVELNLSEYFPNSHIVKINDAPKNNFEQEETCGKIKKLLRK